MRRGKSRVSFRLQMNALPPMEPHLTLKATLPSVGISMPATISSAALRGMTESERARVVDEAFHCTAAELQNYLLVLDARLRVFELRYELPTAALGDALASGKLRDTADVSEWLFWAHLRSDLARETRP